MHPKKKQTNNRDEQPIANCNISNATIYGCEYDNRGQEQHENDYFFFFLEIRFSLNTSSCVMINSLNAMDGLLYFWSIHIQNVCKRYEYAMKKNKFYVIYDMLSVKME